MIKPNSQIIFRPFADYPYEGLGELFEHLSIDDVYDGMEQDQSFVFVDGKKISICADNTRNSIAVDDVSEVSDETVDKAVELLKKFASGELKCSDDHQLDDSYVAFCDRQTNSFEYWA